MTAITLETIKARQDELAAMIAAFNAAKATITIPAATIELKPGEQYAGLVLKDDGTPSHHLVLLGALPDQRMTWQQAKDWVWSINGAQPTQHEAALIRVHCRNYIEPGGYWLDESDRDPDYAWVYYFSTCGQYCIQKSRDAFAIAVRRIPIGGRDVTTPRPHDEQLIEAFVDATAHLVAAASAYEKHASRARHLKPRAVADALFTTRLNDFKQAAARAQAACQKLTVKENK